VSTTPKLRVRIFCPIDETNGVLLGGVLPSGNHAYISKGSVATPEFRAQLVESGFQRQDPPRDTHPHQYWKVPLTENSAFIKAIKSARALVLSSIVMPDA
jgi:hypothetical protein